LLLYFRKVAADRYDWRPASHTWRLIGAPQGGVPVFFISLAKNTIGTLCGHY
jgi:hypothetical protein